MAGTIKIQAPWAMKRMEEQKVAVHVTTEVKTFGRGRTKEICYRKYL